MLLTHTELQHGRVRVLTVSCTRHDKRKQEASLVRLLFVVLYYCKMNFNINIYFSKHCTDQTVH